MESLIGKQIEKYEIKSFLAQGGMGNVYKGIDTESPIDREVAIKFLRADVPDKQIKRFMREAAIMGQLDHPAIVPLITLGSIESSTGNRQPYFVMELMETSLANIISKSDGLAILQNDLVRLIEQVASALDFAHKKNIVHRDLKPGNILLDKNNNAYLADFGIAKLLDRKTQLTSNDKTVGTPYYMSPEQIEQGEIDQRADVYAFGCVVYELLSGKKPFEQSTSQYEIYSAHINQPLPELAGQASYLPRDIDDYIAKATEKKKEDRYASVGDFAADLIKSLEKIQGFDQTSIMDRSRPLPPPPMTPDGVKPTANTDDNQLIPQPAAHTIEDEVVSEPEWITGPSTASASKPFFQRRGIQIALGLLVFALVVGGLYALLGPGAGSVPENRLVQQEGELADGESGDPPDITVDSLAGAADSPPEEESDAVIVAATPTPEPEPTSTEPRPTPVIEEVAAADLTPSPTPVQISILSSDNDAIIDNGSRLEQIKDQPFLDHTGFSQIQTNTRPLALLLDKDAQLVIGPESITVLDENRLTPKLLSGKLLLTLNNQLVQVEVSDQLKLTLDSGTMTVHYDLSNGLIHVECLSGSCILNFESTNIEVLTPGEGATIDLNTRIIERRAADYSVCGPLALAISPGLCPIAVITPTPSPEPILVRDNIGESVEGEPIKLVTIGDGPRAVLLVGGIHSGFAPNTVAVVDEIGQYYTERPNLVPSNVTLYLIPNLNPDAIPQPGGIAGRFNANGVDLNRNFDCRWNRDPQVYGNVTTGAGGDAPVSEPESEALVAFIDEIRPEAVVFWGATARVVGGHVAPGVCNESDQQLSLGITQLYADAAEYSIPEWAYGVDEDLTGDVSNWLNKRGIQNLFVLLYSFNSYDLTRDLKGVQAVLGSISLGFIPQGSEPSPSSSSAPTFDTSSCGNFTSRWMNDLYLEHRDQLGCPTTSQVITDGAYQFFSNGTSIWRRDTNNIYFLRDSTFTYRVQSMAEISRTDNYEWTDLLRGGFGWLWTNRQAWRIDMGDPLEPEQVGAEFTTQNFEGGTIFSFQVESTVRTYILYSTDTTWRQN